MLTFTTFQHFVSLPFNKALPSVLFFSKSTEWKANSLWKMCFNQGKTWTVLLKITKDWFTNNIMTALASPKQFPTIAREFLEKTQPSNCSNVPINLTASNRYNPREWASRAQDRVINSQLQRERNHWKWHRQGRQNCSAKSQKFKYFVTYFSCFLPAL